MKKICLLLLSVLLLLCGCAQDGISLGTVKKNPTADVTVFEYEGNKIKSGLYAYILSEKKTTFIQLLQEEYSSAVNDAASFWNSSPEDGGKPYSELVTADIYSYCKRITVTEALCKKYGIKLTDEALVSQMNTEIEDMINSFVTEEDLDLYLFKYGINTDELKSYYNSVYLIEQLEKYLYGESGVTPIPQNDVKAVFDSDYVKFQHIYIKRDEAANETAEQAALRAKELYGKITRGEVTFEESRDNSSDDAAKTYPDGIIVSKGDTYKEFEEAVFAMSIGEIKLVNDSEGAYIVKRVEVTESDFNDRYTEIEDEMIPDVYLEYVSKYYDSVTVNNAELEKYSIITADIFN